MRMRHFPVVLALALSGCGGRYVYAPVSTTTGADVAGAPAAIYENPPGAPRGDVRLATLGIASLRAGGLEGATSRAIHVALAVSNQSDERWVVDPAEARLTLTTPRDRGEIWATTAEITHPAAVDVPPQASRLIHLYFPLPLQLQREERLPSFEVVWTVHAGSRAITRRTAFRRFLEGPPSPAETEERDLGPGDLRPKDQLPPWSAPPDPTRILPLEEDTP